VLGEASALILQGELQGAQTELEQGAFAHVKARNPENEAKSHLWLARLYLLQGEKRRALSQLGLIGTPVSSPANVRILRDMGLILAEMGAHDPAGSVVRQLEQIAAEYPSLYTRGVAYHVRGELNRAMDRWQEAHNNLQQARMQWGDALTLGSLARHREGRQDYGAALKLYQEVLAHKGLLHNREFAGFWVLAHLGAARCQRQLGNLRPAAEYYDRFLSFWGNQSPGFALVYEAKQQRDSLKALGF
jgi:tetratricopeptide (TPR) repeat protein